ncbi:hypothetical protein [Noviherbaspirillum cavernae]|uniref:hypothetical protein n=1 Tax=Noviherbaspirillum cavernae TaxID=2320862 RepID=UPI0011C3EEB7|nr:hypothetical protein [Noviherbaspirillum cavernae]
MIAVLGSSASQLCLKAASHRLPAPRALWTLGTGAALMLFSIFVAMLVLRTLQLSQLVPFAAGAYVLVPAGGRIFFGEDIPHYFWIGVGLIMTGIILTLF